jgi:hypothetical protein
MKMPVWMTHPTHGRTPAVGSEIEWNEKHGWTREDAKPAEMLTGQEQLAEQYKAKFGSFPHHRMKAATIEAALKAE